MGDGDVAREVTRAQVLETVEHANPSRIALAPHAFCTSVAQRRGSTTLLNSTRKSPPVVLTSRPLCVATIGSNSSACVALKAWRVPASSPAAAVDANGYHPPSRGRAPRRSGHRNLEGEPLISSPRLAQFSDVMRCQRLRAKPNGLAESFVTGAPANRRLRTGRFARNCRGQSSTSQGDHKLASLSAARNEIS